MAGQPNISGSTVNIAPSSLVADGVAFATSTVLIVGSYGNPVDNQIISLTSSRGVLEQIVPAQVATDANGVAQFTVKSLRSGPATLSATTL